MDGTIKLILVFCFSLLPLFIDLSRRHPVVLPCSRPTMDEAKTATPNQHHNALSSCPPQTTQFYMAQLVLAVNHLHTCFPHAAVLHRDLRQGMSWTGNERKRMDAG
jgi:hypothetical protein